MVKSRLLRKENVMALKKNKLFECYKYWFFNTIRAAIITLLFMFGLYLHLIAFPVIWLKPIQKFMTDYFEFVHDL